MIFAYYNLHNLFKFKNVFMSKLIKLHNENTIFIYHEFLSLFFLHETFL